MISKDNLLQRVREGKPLSTSDQLKLVGALSVPAIIAQLSHILMENIDAAMVGSMGAEASAAIGLVATTTWLFHGVGHSMGTGFSVLVAHKIGGMLPAEARATLRQGFLFTIAFGLLLMVIGAAIAPFLPQWLGSTESFNDLASLYFFVFALTLPICLVNHLSAAMLRCSGNMKFPSMMGVAMCLMDVVFNAMLIFDTHEFSLFGLSLTLPGAGLGVLGAALGTALAELVSMVVMTWYLVMYNRDLNLRHQHGSWLPNWSVISHALRISIPLGIEHAIMTCAQIAGTMILAPLGAAAIAANSFGITIESLCYMPGYGIGDAATTLVGQSTGAGRHELCRRFSMMSVTVGMVVMGLLGIVMYAVAPWVMTLMTPDLEVQSLAASALRIEAFVEPMYAAAIVAYGCMVGMGKTIVPCSLNLGSIWVVRIPLAIFFVWSMDLGLNGVWIAMAIELCVRGSLMLGALYKNLK